MTENFRQKCLDKMVPIGYGLNGDQKDDYLRFDHMSHDFARFPSVHFMDNEWDGILFMVIGVAYRPKKIKATISTVWIPFNDTYDINSEIEYVSLCLKASVGL